MDSLAVPRKLWEHPDPTSTEMYRLMQEINKKHGLHLKVSPLFPSLRIEADFKITVILGALPVLRNPTSPILGSNFPLSQFIIQWQLHNSGR
jgi:hypothetical protein